MYVSKKESYQRYFVVKGLDGVVGVIKLFAGQEDHNEAHKKTMRDLAASRGNSFVVDWPGAKMPTEGFLAKVLLDIKATLDDGREYKTGFDYAPGHFFKTTVSVFALGDGYYGVGFYGYSEEPERTLIQKYGLYPALIWGQVSLSVDPVGDTFTFDFDEMAQKLSREFSGSFGGEAIAHAFIENNRHESKDVSLFCEGPFAFTLFLNSLGISPQYEDPWTMKRGTVTGKVSKRHGSQYKPTVILHISKKVEKEERWKNAPITVWKPEEKELLVNLTDRLERAFL